MPAYQENFFTRGPSPLARLTFFSLVAIIIMIADHRFQALAFVRLGVSVVLTPIEQTLLLPGKLLQRLNIHFSDQQRLVAENAALNTKVMDLTAGHQQAQLIRAERTYFASLSDANKRFSDRGLIAEIIRDARNPYVRKVIIDKGSSQGLRPGLVVIDGGGVVGQLTAVGVLTSEVTLSTEKNQSVPVIALRGGLRAIAVGNGRDGTIDIPFIPVAADIQAGDVLVTSGIDGTYPAGLSVATVTSVDRNPAFQFARITATPVSGIDRQRFVKVLTQEELKNYPLPDVKAPDSKPDRERVGPKRREVR